MRMYIQVPVHRWGCIFKYQCTDEDVYLSTSAQMRMYIQVPVHRWGCIFKYQCTDADVYSSTSAQMRMYIQVPVHRCGCIFKYQCTDADVYSSTSAQMRMRIYLGILADADADANILDIELTTKWTLILPLPNGRYYQMDVAVVTKMYYVVLGCDSLLITHSSWWYS